MEEMCDKLFIFSRGVCFLYSSKRVFLHLGDNDCNDYPVLSADTFLPVFYNCVSLVPRLLSISPSFTIHPLIHIPYLLHSSVGLVGWTDGQFELGWVCWYHNLGSIFQGSGMRGTWANGQGLATKKTMEVLWVVEVLAVMKQI